MAAAFPTSIKNFGAARVDGDYIPASDMNTVREEIVAVETALILPANVNVLGNRSAAGEFVQRGTTTIIQSGLAYAISYIHSVTITFPVAFSTPPRVFIGGTSSAELATTGIASTTNFGINFFDTTSGATSRDVQWLAIGA